MLELKEKPTCCGKEMKYDPHVQQMVNMGTDVQQWVCLECGGYVTLTEGQFDEEEFENYKENLEVI